MDFLKLRRKWVTFLTDTPKFSLKKIKICLKIAIPFFYLFHKKSAKIKSKKHPRNPSLSVFPLPPPPPWKLRWEVAWIFFTPVSSDRPEREKYAATIFHDSHLGMMNEQNEIKSNFTFFRFYVILFNYSIFFQVFMGCLECKVFFCENSGAWKLEVTRKAGLDHVRH